MLAKLHHWLHAEVIFPRRVKALATRLSAHIPPGSSVLDVGSGSGWISAEIKAGVTGVAITGIDVLVRPYTHIPVVQFDGKSIPFPDASFDIVMFVDVLHHTNHPGVLLAEAARVARRWVLLKDHFRTGVLGRARLRFMDWIANIQHGVALPYNYLSPAEWEETYRAVSLKPVKVETDLGLYPGPANLVFGGNLQFIALLGRV